MKKTLRELLIDIAKNSKWYTGGEDFDDKYLEEVLREDTMEVWEGDDSEHRWRIDYSVVCSIMDDGVERFFSYSACKGTNDNSWEDAGYYFEGIDNVPEVYAHEVTTIEYKLEEK